MRIAPNIFRGASGTVVGLAADEAVDVVDPAQEDGAGPSEPDHASLHDTLQAARDWLVMDVIRVEDAVRPGTVCAEAREELNKSHYQAFLTDQIRLQLEDPAATVDLSHPQQVHPMDAAVSTFSSFFREQIQALAAVLAVSGDNTSVGTAAVIRKKRGEQDGRVMMENSAIQVRNRLSSESEKDYGVYRREQISEFCSPLLWGRARR